MLTFGVNRAIRWFEPDFAVCLDRKAVLEDYSLFQNTDATLFFADRIKTALETVRFKQFQWRTLQRKQISQPLSGDITEGLAWSGTGAYPAMNLAYLMMKSLKGQKHIILAGVDMNDGSHMDSDDRKDELFPQADLVRQDFLKAKRYLQENAPDFHIWNANPESRVSCFDIIDFPAFLRGLKRNRITVRKMKWRELSSTARTPSS